LAVSDTTGARLACISASRLRRYAPKAELVAGSDTYTAEMEALLVGTVCYGLLLRTILGTLASYQLSPCNFQSNDES